MIKFRQALRTLKLAAVAWEITTRAISSPVRSNAMTEVQMPSHLSLRVKAFQLSLKRKQRMPITMHHLLTTRIKRSQ